MTFTEHSAIVQLWVKNVENGKYTREQVPSLSNLREVVFALLQQNKD